MGAGKSSLLRILAGLLTPASGSILWQGKDMDDDVGAISAEYSLYRPSGRVKNRLLVPVKIWRFGVSFPGTDLVDTALTALHLEAIADHPVRIMSAGQKKTQ